jgi:hypothetical protein
MSIPKAEVFKLIAELLPHVWVESTFLSPVPSTNLPAFTVWNTLRAAAEGGITEAEFNAFADECDRERDTKDGTAIESS